MELVSAMERQKLRKSMEELKDGASGILFCVSKLKGIQKRNEKRSLELELKEKEMQSLSSDFDKKVKTFEKEKSEAGNLKKSVEECTEELRSKKNELTAKLDYSTKIQREIEMKKRQLGPYTAQFQKLCSEAVKVRDQKKVMEEEIDRKKKELSLVLHQIKESKNQFVIELDAKQNKCDSLRVLIQERSEELVAKEKRQKEILEAIWRSSSEMEERAKEVKALETEASDLSVKSERFRQEVEGKEKELDLLRNQIESERKKLIQLKRETEEETERKKKALVLILSKIEESGQKLAALDEQVERAGESRKLFEIDIELKERKLQSLNNLIRFCGQEIDSKTKESGEIRNLIEKQTSEFVATEKRHKEILESICRSSSEMEERGKEIKAAETEARDLNVKSKRFRQEVEDKEKELHLLKNQIESEEKKRIQHKREMEEITDRKKEELSLILDQTKESSQKLAALDEQVETQRRLVEKLSAKLASKKMKLECVEESSKSFMFNLEVKEKRFQALSGLIAISREQLDLKTKELVAIQGDVELQKQLREMIAVLVNRLKQPAAEATPIDDEDALMHDGISASLTRHEVFSILRALTDPAEYVLELVQDDISEGSGLLHDSFLEILVLLFEELAKIQRPDKSQFQLKAEEVATLWKGKITIEAPKSSLEALAFLLFIVAYKLQKVITQEETALLASFIAHYSQAPTLLNSLGLKLEMIPEIVLGLIEKQQYISAVRLICVFELKKDFSPSLLLKEEIIKLRRSALETRPTDTESSQSQARDEDGRRLRAILELVADYKLKIKLPGDLIAKLMVQRENSSSAPLVRCSVEHGTSSSNPQASSPNPAAQLSSLTLPVMSSDVKSINETCKLARASIHQSEESEVKKSLQSKG